VNRNPKQNNETPAPWHSLPVNEVLRELDSDGHQGLSREEAARRLERVGLNLLEETGVVPWPVVLGHQFVDVMIFILFLAALVAMALGEWIDAIAIFVILIINGILGFIQEWKAEQAIQALKRMLEPRCNVVRGAEEQTIGAKNLVPGDVVVLETGDRIPADLRLVRATALKIDESALTGESESADKNVEALPADTPLAERASAAWMGTAVTNGRAIGVVTATGMDTEFGRIATITQSVGREVTPLQRQLGILGKQLGMVALVVSGLVALAGWLVGKPLLEMLLVGISLAVAVVPEGLPAVVTITLALGVRAMIKRRALLRRLHASETLGTVSVICTDKTGTLTQNQMTVQRVWMPAGEVEATGIGYDPAGHFEQNGVKIDANLNPDLLALLGTGYYCNHARLLRGEAGWTILGEPTEAALVVAAYKARLNLAEPVPMAMELSFNSERKRMTVIDRRGAADFVAHVKGAPEVVLERCTRVLVDGVEKPFGEEDMERALQAVHRYGEQGLRTLAFARRHLDELPAEDKVEHQLTFLGIVGILDPPHLEVPEAVRLAGLAGIRVIMITGDNPKTAHSIARQIGMNSSAALTGREIDAMDDAALSEVLEGEVLFARTTPEHKMRIVKLLQQKGEVVGMTGDGVNDAPALKQAEIGIAMGVRGTDVAKGASDMILTDDNFASIINAVEEGRREYDNIQKFVRYLLSSNMGEVIAISINILLGGPLILLPVQILWMNLVTDGVTAVALGMEPAEEGIMRQPPRGAREPILDRRGILMVLLLGGYIGLATLWLFHHYLEKPGGDPALAHTVAFTSIILLEKMNVLNFRALRSPLVKIGFFSNPWVLAALAGTIGLQVAVVYVPVLQNALHTTALGLADWGLILIVAVPIFLLTEIYKRVQFGNV